MTGILGHLAAEGSPRKVTVAHVDESQQSWAQEDEMRMLVDKLDDASLHPYFRAEGQRLNVADLDVSGADVYLCGGEGFLQSIRDDLAQLDPANVYFELFSPNDWLIG